MPPLAFKSPAALTVLIATLLLALGTASSTTTRSDLCRAVRKCLRRLDSGKKCRILPTPQDAVAPAVAPGTFLLKQLRGGVWRYNDGVYLTLIVYRNSRLVMLDIPESVNSAKMDGSTTRLTDAAEQVLDGEVPTRIDVVYSHAHYDHIGKSGDFLKYMRGRYPSAKTSIWGTFASKQMIELSVTKKIPVPNVFIASRGRVLSLGDGLNIEMRIVGGHSGQDLLLYIPPYKAEPGIVMYVDVVFPKWVPPVNLAITEDVGRFIGAQREILKLDFEIVIGGHFMMGVKKDIAKNLQYAEDLVEAAKKAVATVGGKELAEAGIGLLSNPLAREFGNQWFALLGVTRGAQSDVCYKIMLRKWGCRLSGIDVVGRGHCFTALTYLITDY